MIDDLVQEFLADTSPELLREEIEPRQVAEALGLERHPRLAKKVAEHLNNMEKETIWE